MKCFIDMDGVLADFVAGACLAHRRESPYLNGNGAGIFDMEKLWAISAREFWAPTNSVDFWMNLPKTPEADEIVSLAISEFGLDNVAILTAPSLFDGCIGAKRAWITKHYPALARHIIFSASKEFLSGDGRLLIDDRDKNVDVFRLHGGAAILVPRPWNRDYAHSDSAWTSVRENLLFISQTESSSPMSHETAESL